MTIRNSFPDVRPALNLDFANSKRLDPRITFTRSSTGTYVDEFGVIKTAASNEARFDHDGSGNSLGLLIEESRTNLLQYSEEFDNAAWIKSNITVTANTTAAPSGSINADKLVASTTNTSHYVLRILAVTAGTHTLSVYAKSSGLDWVALNIYDGSGYRKFSFNVSTGEKGIVASGLSSTITPASNGWYRITATYTSTVTGNNSIHIHLYDGESTENFLGDGVSGAYFWGAQLEAGSFPTSYIPTSGSTATRSADVASISNAFSTTAFTVINEPFGSASGSDTLQILGAGSTPIRKTSVYDRNLTQTQINAVASVTDEFWRWRILGSSFALPNFATDGQVTVDWGDGTVETLTTGEHMFSNGGGYHEIGFRLDSGTYFAPRVSQFQDRVVSLGPGPSSMKVDANQAFIDQTNLLTVDSIIKFRGIGDYMFRSYPGKSIGYIDTSEVTSFREAWRASSLTSFPAIDFSGATLLRQTWEYCGFLTSFGVINTSTITSFTSTWKDCSGLTSFPLIDTSSGTSFSSTWQNCTSLTSFPLIDTSSGTSFYAAWAGATSLATFPANMFDTTGTLDSSAFQFCWFNCALTAASIENILVSLDTNGSSNISLDINGGTNAGQSTWTSAATTAYNNLVTKGWTINANS